MGAEIINPADRDEWLALRRKDVTASVAGALLGVHPYTTAYQLWAEKSGRVQPDNADNSVLRRGRLLEPVIFAMLAEDRPEWRIQYPLGNQYHRDPVARIGATPDAFATRPDIFGLGIVQGKTVHESDFREKWVDQETGEVVLPLWIAVQAITEAKLTHADWASVALMVIGRGIDLHVVDVPLHIGVWGKIKASVEVFWSLVESGLEPEPNWERDGATVAEIYGTSMPERRDLTANGSLDDKVTVYVEARKHAAQLTATVDALRPQILREIGSAELAYTANWNINARSTTRAGDFGLPVKSRILRIKPREGAYAGEF